MMSEKKPAKCLHQPMIAGKDKREEFTHRWLAVLEYYDIDAADPEQEKKLLWALLQEKWAGFRTKKPGGSPRKHSFHDMMWVHMDFHRIKAECPPKTKDPAIWRMMANDPFYKEQELTFDALKGIFNRSREPEIARKILGASDAFMKQVAEVEEAIRKKN